MQTTRNKNKSFWKERMKCDKCQKEFQESQLEESHDVPRYLFEGYPKERKQQADKHGRHWLCKGEQGCRKKYERTLQEHLRPIAKAFAKEYFNDDNSKRGEANT
jgi:hypothetical protein